MEIRPRDNEGNNLTPAILRALSGVTPIGETLSIPAGVWWADPVNLSKPGNFTAASAPIYIKGEGVGRTVVMARPGAGQSVFRWDASQIPAGYCHYGGISDLTLYSSAPNNTAGDGIIFQDTVFTGADRLHIIGFNRGIYTNNAQNQVLREVHVQANQIGLEIDMAGQVDLENFRANQNYVTGVKVARGLITWSRGLLQGTHSGAAVLLEPALPNSIHLSMQGIWVECNSSGGLPFIWAKAAPGYPNGFTGTLEIRNVTWNVANQTILEEAGYATYACAWTGDNGAIWIRGIGNQPVFGIGMPYLQGRFVLDPGCQALSAFMGYGNFALRQPQSGSGFLP